MQLSFHIPTPLEYFAALVQGTRGFRCSKRLPALRRTSTPAVTCSRYWTRWMVCWRACSAASASRCGGLERLRALNQFFFVDLDFGGNVNDYYAPDNSYLHQVLRTRRGIPISLGVLWMELAQGIGLHVRGVAFPGHFMVKALLPGGRC